MKNNTKHMSTCTFIRSLKLIILLKTSPSERSVATLLVATDPDFWNFRINLETDVPVGNIMMLKDFTKCKDNLRVALLKFF